MGTQIKRPEAYNTYGEYFAAMRNLAAEYGDIPMDRIWNAWTRASAMVSPQLQNRRVKRISTMPEEFAKDKIVEMLKAPDESEKPLRQVAHALEWSAYPYRKMRMTYQGVNTYRYYHYPAYLTADEAKSDTVRREGVLLDKFNRAIKPDQCAHQIVGQVIQEGKVAYTPRWSVDKPHNKINYAFMQQIPSDWMKIVGFNSESKYTVMFDMVYFLSVPGADWRQFGDLFQPYLDDFESILTPYGRTRPDGLGKRFVYASHDSIRGADGQQWYVDMEKFSAIRDNAAGSPELYNQNGRWAYWVTLPVEKAWVFELDDATRTVAPPFSGLMLSFDQLSALEDVQLEILQNPLIQIAFGEMETTDENKGAESTDDPILLSPAGRATYMAYWMNMLAEANTSGIAFYAAPFKNMHMESLAEAPNATNISSSGYAYAVQKSGLSGLIPINQDPRAGAVEISAKLEERYCICVYNQMRNMMESLYRQIGTRFEWRFVMFGGFITDKEDLENTRKGLQVGILPETLKYLALRGISIWEDMGISRMVKESGLLDLRIPLVSSYNMKQENSGLPPQPQDPDNQGGRPTSDIDDALSGGSESQESDLDGGN